MSQSIGESEITVVPPGGAAANPDHLYALGASATALCDRAMQYITGGQALAGFRILGPELSNLHQASIDAGCEDGFIARIRRHPLFELCQQDPYTARAFQKPRGYAGDAVMMDFVYSGRPPEGTSPLGRQIFGATTRVPMGLSVLYRRSLLHSYINDHIARRAGCRILSVASGHCREIKDSLLFDEQSDCEFVALDQDNDSMSVVARDFAHPRLRVLIERVKTLVFGKLDIGEFDFIYSAGLYDYLPDATAALLTSRLSAMLKPGGRLLVANFLPTCYGRGYLSAFMDWHLKYRSAQQLRSLFPDRLRPDVLLSRDPHENVAYAEVTRRD